MINFGRRNSGDFIVYWSDRLRRGKRAREPVPAQSEPDFEVHLPQVIGNRCEHPTAPEGGYSPTGSRRGPCLRRGAERIARV